MINNQMFYIPEQILRNQMCCPQCGSMEEDYDGPDFYICSHCECLHGQGALQDSYEYVIPVVTSDPQCLLRSVPFRLACYDPERGLIIRKGMYDPITLQVTQVGLLTP